MTRRWLVRFAAVGSISVAVAVAIIDGVRGFPSGGFDLLYAGIAIVFIGVGWLIAERQPANVIGPLLLAFGAVFAWYLPANLYLHLPGQPPAAALFVSAIDAPMFILVALVLILFPDGHPPSPRWRWAIVAGTVGVGLAALGYLLLPDPFPLYPDYQSPLGIHGFPAYGLIYASYVVMILLLAIAAVALIVRWRRGSPVERTQIKWVVAAALVMLVTELVNVATFRADQPNALANVLASLGIALVPIAMGIAILRYRLYEIDRLISRSIGYAVVTGILAILFGGAVVLLSTVLSQVAQGQTIAVAASTLAVFALFQPIRRRVQRSIDRRFDRARYDGERTAATFAARLRHEVDMVTVTQDLARTANTAVAPTSLSIWLRTRAARR